MNWEETKSYYANMSPRKRPDLKSESTSRDKHDGPAVNYTKYPPPSEDMVDDASIRQRKFEKDRNSQLLKPHNLPEEYDDNDSDSSSSEKDERSKTPSEENQKQDSNYLTKFFKKFGKKIGIMIIGALAVSLIILSFISIKFFCKENPIKTESLLDFMNEMKKLYPTQDPNMWEYVKVQFEGVKNFSRPAVFMVAHYNHQGEAVEVVGKMGRFAAVYLNNGTEEMKPVIIDHQELYLRDHGELLTRYKSKFIQNRVMIIDGIEKVPGVVAQGFRYFCDEFTPMVEESVMFFTVNLHSCKNSIPKMDFLQAESGSLTEIIEDCLTDSWKSQLDPHILHPVLVRVVSNVIKIL